MEKLATWDRTVSVWWCSQSDNHTDPSLIKQKRKVARFDLQNNVTGPNNNCVVTGSVFGNLCVEKKYQSSWKSFRPTDSSSHFCQNNSLCPQQRARLLPQLIGGDYVMWFRAKNFNPLCLHLLPLFSSSLSPSTVTLPQKTISLPVSERVRQRPVYWWWLCDCCVSCHVIICNRFIPFSRGHRVCCWSQSQLSPGEGRVHPGQVASSSQGPQEQFGVQYLAQGHFDMQLSSAVWLLLRMKNFVQDA